MSKRFKYIIPVLALLLFACDSDDDGFYNSVYVQSAGLMSIENPSATYSVGDVIQIETHIPRLLAEPGKSELLDVRETTDADSFQFTFYLERLTDNGWEVVDISNNYVDGTEGHANVGFYVQGFLDFDAVADQYLYNGGVEATQAGVYRLNFSNTTSNFNKLFLRSDSKDDKIVLNIFTESASLDDVGSFQFTVN